MAALLGALVLGCQQTLELTVAPEAWVYEDRAISIEIDAPADLNARSGRPHTLAIGVFQLSDPNTFTGMSKTFEGAVELLSKGRIDDTVADFRQITVQPGERKTVVFARAQSAQYVGLISGYFHLTPRHDVRLFPVPLVASKRGVVERGLAAVNLISNQADATPGPLFLQVTLGRTGTQQIRDVQMAGQSN